MGNEFQELSSGKDTLAEAPKVCGVSESPKTNRTPEHELLNEGLIEPQQKLDEDCKTLYDESGSGQKEFTEQFDLLFTSARRNDPRGGTLVIKATIQDRSYARLRLRLAPLEGSGEPVANVMSGLALEGFKISPEMHAEFADWIEVLEVNYLSSEFSWHEWSRKGYLLTWKLADLVGRAYWVEYHVTDLDEDTPLHYRIEYFD